jgi:Cd2+/Zn2+-exporting ATPase
VSTSAESRPPALEPEHPPYTPGTDGCLEILSDRLRHSPGVIALEADFPENRLTVRYQPSLVEPDQLNALADEVGALFAQRVTTCERRTSVDACEECALRLGRVPGALDDFRITAEQGKVGLSRRLVPEDTVELVRPLGKRWGTRFTQDEQEQLGKGRAMALLTGGCLGLLIVGMILERALAPEAWVFAVYAASAVSGSWFALRSTLRSLLRRRLDVNLLMILAALGAASIGYVFEAAVLMFLFSLSNTLEVYTMRRTRRAIHALLKLRPSRALVRRGDREIEVEAESVRIGERVIVKPGVTLPVDGVVAAGASLIDQSTLTGESMPVEKQVGDRVFAGTLNQQGALEVRVTREAGDTTLARIVALVQEAQEQKSRTEEIADWVGRYYTIVVVIGALAMIVVPLWLGQPFIASFYRAMTLLVVASPCALVIATPATVLSAIANAARNGILFKGGRFLEALGRVRAVAFDKTGTLTRGRFAITDVEGFDGAEAGQIVGWAASAEKRSQHPLAQAVVREAERRGLAVRPAEHLVNHLGKGVVARLDGATIEIGTPELFRFLEVTVPAEARARIAALSADAKTAMLVRNGDRWGVLAAQDEIRAAAPETVAALKHLGVKSVVLLSGDSAPTVAAVARRAGVDEHRGELLPEDKVKVVGELERQHGAVAMVGDGINDAPALARATVGVAMGGVGCDAAMESADVVLMGDDLTALPYALGLARRARAIVIQNVAIASGVMLTLVALVFVGHLTPLGALKLPVAVSGHEGSTVVVILNGLRLLSGKRA